GVDCSGFTAISVARMGGLSAEVGPGLNMAATAYRPGGAAITQQGYTQVKVGEEVRNGDVVGFMNSNHVVVLRWFLNEREAPGRPPPLGSLRAAKMILIGESVGEAEDGGDGGVGRVTDTRTWMCVWDAQTTPRSRYANRDVHQVGAASWTLFEPQGNET